MSRALTLPSPKGRGNNGEKRFVKRWNELWFEPWGPENLGLTRALVSGLFLWSHLSWDFSHWLNISDAFWLPVPLIHALGIDIPSPAFVLVLQRVFFIALSLGFIGLFSRAAFAVTFLSGLYLFGMRQSFGFVEPAEGHFFIMFGIFAMSRCGDAFSVDSLVRRWRGRNHRIQEKAARGTYSWPVRLMQLLFVSVFFAGGVAKMRLGGLDWIFSDNLALTVQVIDLGPLSHWLAENVLLGQVLSVGALALELLSPLALFSRRARIVIVPCLFFMQIGFAVTMRATFRTFFLTYAFWIPWDLLLDLARGESGRRRTLARVSLLGIIAVFVCWTAVIAPFESSVLPLLLR